MAVALVSHPIEGRQRFTSRAEGVRVDVLVTDGSRRVRDLTANDFEVRDNGVEQRVTQLDVEHSLPVNVICVFDASTSVAGTRLRELVAAGGALIDELRERDRIAVLSFATHVSLPLPLSDERDRARQAIASLRAEGLTALRDATFAGLGLRDADPARTLLLIFSDGDDTASWLSASRVIESARRSDLVVYAVRAPGEIVVTPSAPFRLSPDPRYGQPVPALRNPPSRRAADEHAKFLDIVATETGGRVVDLESDKDLAPTFTSILGEFRDRYVLSYSPSGVDTPGWHELTVRVKGKPVKVTARRGYFAQ